MKMQTPLKTKKVSSDTCMEVDTSVNAKGISTEMTEFSNRARHILCESAILQCKNILTKSLFIDKIQNNASPKKFKNSSKIINIIKFSWLELHAQALANED
jgi:hypothetical protein